MSYSNGIQPKDKPSEPSAFRAGRLRRTTARLLATGVVTALCISVPVAAFAAPAPTPAPTSAPAASPTAAQITQTPTNDPPLAYPDNFNIVANHTVKLPWSTVMANDVDADGDTFSLASALYPAHGVATFGDLGASAIITYTPAKNYTGADSIRYFLKDSQGAWSYDAGVISINVTPNHNPAGVADQYAANGATPLTVAAKGVLSNDSDVDGDLPTATVAVTANPLHGTVKLNASGGFTYTATAGFTGLDAFYYQVSDGFGGMSATTPVSIFVQTPSFTSAATPTISGTAVLGATLSTSVNAWLPTPTSWKYQWMRGIVPIPNATQPTYVLTVADVGQKISVAGTGSKSGLSTLTKTSLPTAPVVQNLTVTPTPLVLPNIKYPQVNTTLTVKTGVWGPGSVSFGYQWKKNGVAIGGATGASYLLAAGDLKSTITVTVTGSRPGFLSVAKTSSPTPKIVAGTLTNPPVSVLGGQTVGSTLSATVGTWAVAPVSVKYAWLRNGVAIPGAVAATYKATEADWNKVVTVRITASKAGYNTLTFVSDATAPVLKKFTTVPKATISGNVALGKTLTAVAGTYVPGGGTVTYYWFRGMYPIVGSTGKTYVLTAADKGKQIHVNVGNSKQGYAGIVVTSNSVSFN
ncbi:MAG: conserved secreted protein [Subtercola sp.]|nr:conserved secreted protein [Subtercola sp.]